MSLLWSLGLLVFGFIMLIKGADVFVEGASGIAKKLKIPQIIIGLTVVAFGTSAPEAAVSISAGIKGTSGIAVGNILGSNIMNILLILGITACITSLKVQKSSYQYEIPFMLFISAVLFAMGTIQKELNRISGIILWVLFILFFVYLIWQARHTKSTPDQEVSQEIGYKNNILLLIFVTLVGLVALVLGSNLAVDGATDLAKVLGLSDRVIGLTVVAFGTSLPELLTSITAAKKGNCDIAIGNIVGSNIFNILFVLGTTSLITSIPYGREYFVDGLICIAAVVILMLAIHKNKKLTKAGGICMLSAFAAYFVYLMMR